ncbi:RNA polymerase subunit Rpb4/RPC9 [Dillenia turbinata]|uniref:DNA-directed RNA polymerase III subunit RPC9 n=1 Tax=Dillenia turbinata TaxID=194707 RepID=A0AAN8ZDN6_9MAGN
MGKGQQTPLMVLTYMLHSFDLDTAAMFIGLGLGVNHHDVSRKCCKPACYFVAKDYGHVDMLDDETKSIRGRSTYCLCKNGNPREPMMRFVGGTVVAFMKAYLSNDHSDLLAKREANDWRTTISPAICLNCFIGDENAVLDFLRSRGATKDPTRVMNSVAPSEFKVGFLLLLFFDYFVESACCNQTIECINEFFDKCNNYNLAPAEILNIINIRPSSMVEIDPIVEEGESRFGEGIQDLVDLGTEVLPPPPSEPKPEEGMEEDEGEAQEDDAKEGS